MNWLKKHIDLVGDEPGTLLILLMLACYLLFFPGGACSVADTGELDHAVHADHGEHAESEGEHK